MDCATAQRDGQARDTLTNPCCQLTSYQTELTMSCRPSWPLASVDLSRSGWWEMACACDALGVAWPLGRFVVKAVEGRFKATTLILGK